MNCHLAEHLRRAGQESVDTPGQRQTPLAPSEMAEEDGDVLVQVNVSGRMSQDHRGRPLLAGWFRGKTDEVSALGVFARHVQAGINGRTPRSPLLVILV